MAAGLFGHLGYDMVRAMERLGPPNPDVLGVPDATMIRPTVMVVFWMPCATRSRSSRRSAQAAGVSAKSAHETGIARLEAVIDALEKPVIRACRGGPCRASRPWLARSNTGDAEYEGYGGARQGIYPRR